MASSEDNNNHDVSEMGFRQRAEMRSGSMFNNKSSSGSGDLFGSGWDPLENYGGGSSMVVVPQTQSSELGGAYLENHHHQGLLHHYQSGDLAPKLASFGSGGFSEMVNNPYVNLNPECSAQTNSASSPNKRRLPHSNFKNGDASGDNSSENMIGQDDKKKQKTNNPNSKGKQIGKQAKDNSDSGGPPKEDYIHVRAKRGQATNSHSLAERVRRERISERMKLLQDLVPGCNKITGKAVMLDEIINYVQSLQQQVEFLSMKLATVNPELNIDIDIDHILSKDILNSRNSNSNLGFVTGLSSSQHYPQGSMPVNPPYPSIHPQPVWDNDLHNLLQMGFDSNPGINNNLGPGGSCAKSTNSRGF